MKNFNVPCGRSGCPKTFKTVGARRTHISRDHKGFDTIEDDFQNAAGNYVSEMKGKCCTVFSNLKTKHQQNAYFKKNMFLIEPKIHRLTKRVIKGGQARVGENRELILEDDKLYISIIDLVRVLSNEKYKKLFESEQPSQDDVLRSFMDSAYIKSNKLLQEHGQECVLFVLYFDEGNLTDTASARPTKIGFFHLIIGRIHPQNRSK